MSSVDNTALYCNEDVAFEVRRGKDIRAPSDGEILIQTIYSGVNPADVKHCTILGIYPVVLGYDFCGKVLEVTAGSKFKPGDLLAGYTHTGLGRPAKYGTHQDYLVCPEEMSFLVPENLPPHHAACLSVVVMTACDALYNIFHFSLPGENQGTKESTPFLIWGGSSSVGLSTIQLARASGIHPIFVTASPKHHPLLLRLGATCCFDYKSPNVSSEINAALTNGQWGPLMHGFDAVGSHAGGGSAQLMAECVSQDAVLSSVVFQHDTRFRMPFAAPNSDVTVQLKDVPHPIKFPARRADYERAWKAVQWAVAHYGSYFELPSVEIFDGTAEEALNEVLAVAEGRRGFGKLALQHPLR